MDSCVYFITNTANGFSYIGSTKNFKQRKWDHVKTLNACRHRNKPLQSDWDLYGRDSFVFEIICEAGKEDALELEDLILKEADASTLYNVRKSAYGFEKGNTEGCFHRSEDTKKRMSIAFSGRKFSEQHRKHISEARSGTKASAETKEKMSAMRQRGDHPRAKQVVTPDGVFACQNDAADFYGKSSAWVRKRCNDARYPDFNLLEGK